MSEPITRRSLAALATGLIAAPVFALDDPPPAPPAVPVEAPLVRDYPAPKFNPRWAKPQTKS